VIETVNLHVVRACNLRCTYCFGSFPERPERISFSDWCAILDQLASAGVRRANFSGGEPTLHRDLASMLRHARNVGLQTSVISNGARLSDDILELLDLVGITLDSADDDALEKLGRRRHGDPSYVAQTLDLAARVHRSKALLKVNTVVTRHNVDEDMSATLLAMKVWKWKPLQFTLVPGENEKVAGELSVTRQAYASFVARHRKPLEAAGTWVADEADDVVRSTYVMVDPSGRLFRSTPCGYAKSEPILNIGFEAAVEQVGGYDRAAFVARGGHVDVARLVRRTGGEAS